METRPRKRSSLDYYEEKIKENESVSFSIVLKEESPKQPGIVRSNRTSPLVDKDDLLSPCSELAKNSTYNLDLSNLQDFFNCNNLSDVWFLFKEDDIPMIFYAHKLILSLRSSFFKHKFTSIRNVTSSNDEDYLLSKFTVKETSYDVFSTCMRWVYFDEFKFDSDRDFYFYLDVLKACKIYQLRQLSVACVSVLVSYITVKNVLEITESAYEINDDSLSSHCISFVKKQNENVMQKIIVTAANSSSLVVVKDILIATSDSAVLWAVKLQREDVVKALIEQGCSVDACDVNGRVPLEVAIKNGNINVIKTLVSNSCNVNAKLPIVLDTMLHVAIEYGNEEQIMLLLSSGALINECNCSGRSPLHISSARGKAKICSILLERQAVPNLQDFEGNTALHLATDPVIIDLLLGEQKSGSAKSRSNPNIPNNFGQTPLFLATKRGDVQVMLRLIDKGSSIATLDDELRTPLHAAAISGVPATVLILLQSFDTSSNIKEDESTSSPSNNLEIKRKKWINSRDVNGETALHIATMAFSKNVRKVLEALLEAEAEVNIQNKKLRTALMLVASKSHEFEDDDKLVKLLIQYGGDIHIRDVNLDTALHLAVKNGNMIIANELVKNGSSLSVVNAFSQTPLDLCKADEVKDLLQYINKIPQWISNEDSETCQTCKNSFSVTLRRHHCRHCGRVICQTCSSKKIPILKFDIMEKVRTCNPCYEVLSQSYNKGRRESFFSTSQVSSPSLAPVYGVSTVAT